MKAVICTKYGPPEVLSIQEVPQPVPGNNEILVQIKATTVNSGDIRVRGLAVKGVLKVIMRLVLGISKPRKPILGTTYAGVVVQTGPHASRFTVGDEVFGMTGFQFGTYATHICVAEKSPVLHKPINASFEEAAALPFGGQTAIYFLEKANIKERKHATILIIGATGSVGTAAIQVAKFYEASVTAVCSTKGVPLVQKIGLENFITYDTQNFTECGKKFDIIFDAVGKTSKKQCKNLLNQNGIYLSVAGLSYAAESTEQLVLLKELFEKGLYDATIDRTYTIDKVVEAHHYVETGRKKGNVVLLINE